MHEYITQVLKEQSNTTYSNCFTKLPEHVPCLSHIIQLSQGNLMGQIKIKPKRKEIQKKQDSNEVELELNALKADPTNCLDNECWLPWTLAKVNQTLWQTLWQTHAKF